MIRNNPDGFSVTPDGRQPTDGYMVSLPGRTHLIDPAELNGPQGHEVVAAHTAAHSDVYKNPAMHIGGWTNDATGKMHLDPSENIKDRATAERLGRERNQIAIYDVKNKRTIETGGTGE